MEHQRMLSECRCHPKFKAERNESWREESKEEVLAAKGTKWCFLWWGWTEANRLWEDGLGNSAQPEVRKQIMTDKTLDQRQWWKVWDKIVDDCSTKMMKWSSLLAKWQSSYPRKKGACCWQVHYKKKQKEDLSSKEVKLGYSGVQYSNN